MVLKTERLILRPLDDNDFDALAAILQDERVMTVPYVHGCGCAHLACEAEHATFPVCGGQRRMEFNLKSILFENS